MSEDKRTLPERLAAVSAEVERLGYDGQVGGYETYKYTSINAIADLARPLLASHGVAIVPGPVEVLSHDEVTSKKGAVGSHVVIRRAWSVMGGGEEMYAQSIGASIDYGDKAYNKAHTFARKNFLVDLLNLSTGEDPDAEQPEGGRRAPVRRSEEPDAPPPPPPRDPPSPKAKPQWRTRYEELIALGHATDMSEEQTKQTIKAAGVETATDLDRDDKYVAAHDAVTGFVGGDLPVAEAADPKPKPPAKKRAEAKKPSDLIADKAGAK